LGDVLADMKKRDEIDSTRTHAPLTVAPDAIVIDTTGLTVQEVVEKVLGLLGKRRRSSG
jgi:cytidylate kinase